MPVIQETCQLSSYLEEVKHEIGIHHLHRILCTQKVKNLICNCTAILKKRYYVAIIIAKISNLTKQEKIEFTDHSHDI